MRDVVSSARTSREIRQSHKIAGEDLRHPPEDVMKLREEQAEEIAGRRHEHDGTKHGRFITIPFPVPAASITYTSLVSSFDRT